MTIKVSWSQFNEHIAQNMDAFTRLYIQSLTLARIAGLQEDKKLGEAHVYKHLVPAYATSCMIEAGKILGLKNDRHPSVLRDYAELAGNGTVLQKIVFLTETDFNFLRQVRNNSVAHRTSPEKQPYLFHSGQIFPLINKTGLYLMHLAIESLKHDPEVPQASHLEYARIFMTHHQLRLTQMEPAVELDAALYTNSYEKSKFELDILMKAMIEETVISLSLT